MTYVSRLVDLYFIRLFECQGELEQFSKEILDLQKAKEIDEFDVYYGEPLNVDKFEKSCDKFKDIIETIANDFEKWISNIKSYPATDIWSIEKVKNWKKNILIQINFIEQSIEKDLSDIKPKIRSLKEHISEGKRDNVEESKYAS